MTTYKQITRLDWDDVQNLCIKRNWYTHGTHTEFMTLQEKVWVLEFFEDENWVGMLQDIAEDIKAHSDTEYDVPEIMTALNMKCRSWFEAA